MNDGKVVLNVNEVAEMLDLSRNSIYAGLKRGEIPYIRVGKRLLIPRVALEAMLKSKTDVGSESIRRGVEHVRET